MFFSFFQGSSEGRGIVGWLQPRVIYHRWVVDVRQGEKKLLSLIEKSKCREKNSGKKLLAVQLYRAVDRRLMARCPVTGECPGNARQRHQTKCTLIPMPR
jgi:hypothetical protein